MNKLVSRLMCLALILTASGCCCHGSHRLWPFCGTRRCYTGGSYMVPSSPCNPCPTGACPTGTCPPSGAPYYPSGSYNSYDTITPASGPVAAPVYVPTAAMAPIESLPTY